MVTETTLQTPSCAALTPAPLDAIATFAEAGFDHVCIHQVGPDQAGFVDFYEREIVDEARELVVRGPVSAAA